MAHQFVMGAGQVTSIPTYHEAKERGLKLYDPSIYTPNLDQRTASAYYTGLSGLSSEDREEWEKQYASKIRGMSEYDKDNLFRNQLFIKHFSGATEGWKKEAWDNRRNLSKDERDAYFSRLAIEQNLDGDSDAKETPLSLGTLVSNPVTFFDQAGHKLSGSATLREQAMQNLDIQSREESYTMKRLLDEMDSTTLNKYLKNLDDLSGEVSPYYKMYKDTDKLSMSLDEKKEVLASFMAHAKIGGETFAEKALGNYYQDKVANNQSLLEKGLNSGVQFIDSGVGFLIRAAGMAGAALTIGKEEGEGYWENVMDNAVTRYGDNVATTNSYSTEEQERLKELGMSDNAILNTVDQQNSLFSANTPFELFGQYGFSTMSTLLSFGASSLIRGASKAAAWGAKIAMGGKALNATERGVNFLRNVLKLESKANVLVPGAIGMVEGGMNAAMTREETLKNLKDDITNRYNKKASQDIDNFVSSDPVAAAARLRSLGYDITDIPIPDFVSYGSEGQERKAQYSPEQIKQMQDMLKSNPQVLDEFKQKYQGNIADETKAAEESAMTAMYWDYWTNSAINGIINSTLKATLQAPKVQNALSKIGIRDTPIGEAIKTVRQGDRWVAQAKHMTKGQAFKNRLKEAGGEMFEEYTQDLSSAFGQGYAQNKMQQYIDSKYGASPGATAAQNDFWMSFGAGLQAAGDAAVSFDAIKSGLYGGLSTALGGPNLGMKQGANGNMVASGITWRSAFTPLWSNKERDAVNQQRDKMAEHFNTYFSDESMQKAIFDAGGTADWLFKYQESIENKDEKKARDAKVGAMFGNIITINDLKGTGYYDAIMATLHARANFRAENLQNPDSEESKAADQFIASTQNRGQNISREEALETVQKNAKEMLGMMDMVEKETRSIEKTFGENIDRDVKASMIFNKIVIDDYKKRIGQLDEEINQVTSELNSQGDNIPNSSLGAKSKRIIARFGSLSNAVSTLSKLEAQKAELDELIKDMKAEKKKGSLSKEDEEALAMAEYESRQLDRDIKSINSAKDDYSFEAKHQDVVRDGATYSDPVDSQVLSALEIMGLSASDRAFMLDPKHRDRYSQEQQAEIDKVNSVGTSVHQDFTKKIADRSRIERDYKNAMNSQFSLMTDPTALSIYTASVKNKARKVMLQKKNEELLNLAESGDYQSFSERVDDIYNRGDVEEIAAVEDMLTNESFKGELYDFSQSARDMFKRYSIENDRKKEVYDWAEKNNFFEENDPRADVFAATLDYLTNRGIDISNIEAGAQALLEAPFDEEGNKGDLYFEHHIARVNEQSPIEEQITGYNSIEETIQTYRDIMSRYNSERHQRELDNEEVIPTETPESASDPAVIPDPTPSGPTIFEIGGSTPEDGHLNEDGEKVGSPTVSDMVAHGEAELPVVTGTNKTTEEAPSTSAEAPKPNSVIESFLENSNEEVAGAAEIALRITENTPQFSTEAREQAKTIIEGLSINSFDTVQEFTDAIIARANALDSKADENETQVPSILRQVVAKVLKAQSDKKEINTTSTRGSRPVSPFFDRRRNAISFKAKRFKYQFTEGTPDSGILTSMNIAYMRQSRPDSPIVRYYAKYGIEDALRNGILTQDSKVMFITDDTLTDEVKSSMEANGVGYTEDNLPIIAVVESSNGPITINVDGQDKHFQPVGVMSATGVQYSPGSNRMAPIRRLASSNTGISLVKHEDGSPIETTLYKPIVAATSFDSDRKGQDNNNVIDVGQNDLEEHERGTLEGYRKARRNFINRLSVVTDDDGEKMVVFEQDKLNGETLPLYTFVTPVQNTKNSRGETVTQVVGYKNGLIYYNSRTRRAAASLASFIGSFSDEEMSFSRDANDQIIPLGDTEKILSSMASTLENQISNFLYISPKTGWHYSITATDQVVDGKRVYSLDLVNDNSSMAPIHLTSVYKGMTEEANKDAQKEFLKNLLIDENGEVRMENDKDSFVKWQVPYTDVEKSKEGDKKAKENLEDIYDDGILEVSASNVSFKYIIQGIVLRAPFKLDESRADTTVANSSNATPSAPVNEPVVISNGQVVKDGAIIDSDTGAVIQGEDTPPTSQAAERAKEAVTKITSNPKGIRLTEDGSAYIDNDGTRYARVTSIIAADIEAGERFDPNSPWATPSTNIGTGIDEFVRDFFAGEVIDFSKYPNVTQEDLQKFAEQLTTLKNKIESEGLTVVPRDVTVTGQIEVADNDGKIHTINVAGTLDLLAYDGKGNFYIFDMKTNRSGIDQHKKEKYARQLSLYKDLLEKNYGVQVKALNIIPIDVSYPEPIGVKNGTADYSVSPKRENQLLIDGKEFRGASPNLGDYFAVPYKPLRVVYDRLTDEERKMLSGIEETLNEGTGVVEAPTTPVTPIEVQVAEPAELPINPTLGVAVDMSVGDNLWDTDFTGGGWDIGGRLTPIPHHLQWSNLTQEQRDGLTAMHIDEESWSQKEDQEMEHDLECLKTD